MRYNSHTVICILIKHTIQWIFVYSQSCATNTTISNSRTHPVLEEMSHPLTGTPYSSPPQPFAATNLLLISMHLPILDISHKQNSILCMFSIMMFSKFIHVTICINTSFFFNGSIICHCMYISFIQSSADGIFGFFPLFLYYE